MISARSDPAGPIPFEGTYTTQELEQIQQAHFDAVKLCENVITHTNTRDFNRVFLKYFNPVDRDLVVGKLPGPSCTSSHVTNNA
jgi:hypothetical protein